MIVLFATINLFHVCWNKGQQRGIWRNRSTRISGAGGNFICNFTIILVYMYNVQFWVIPSANSIHGIVIIGKAQSGA